MDDSMDPLGQVLHLMSLRACVYFCADFRGPWGMRIPTGEFAQFHLVQHGSCRLSYTGSANSTGTDNVGAARGAATDATEVVLSAGDVVVFPTGAGHALYEGAPTQMADGREVVQAVLAGEPPFTTGPQVSTRLLCGHFEIARSYRHPLISGLPDVMIVRGFDQDTNGWSVQLASLLLAEQDRGLVGSAEIVERLAESLFIQILRTFAAGERSIGFLAALGDVQLRPALDLIHSAGLSTDPGELSLDSMAREVGMSRSSLAERFKAVVGMSPMKYFSAWQLTQAQKALESTDKPIAVIAEESGYASESAFSRAFKSHIGVPPSSLRRRGGI